MQKTNKFNVEKLTELKSKIRPNRQFLVFLFFLALSTAFWLFQTLSETYEEEYNIPVDIRNVPSDVVITSDMPATARITLKDRGTTLLNYKYSDQIPHIKIDKSLFSSTDGHVRLLASELMRQIRPSLATSTQIISFKPDTLEFYYNHGKSKRVPVKLIGEPKAGAGYTITEQRLTPDSVTVYASSTLLDTLQAAYAHIGHLHALEATATHDLSFKTIRGVKFTPAKTQLHIAVDRLIEKKLSVHVQGENFPEGILLRTFPSKVDVIFQVSMTRYRDITPDDFLIAADYNTLPSDGDTKCRLHIKSQPPGVYHVRLSANEVEYILENRNP